MIQRGLPKPLLSIYLEVPEEVALARKPGDEFGKYVIHGQLKRYEARRGEVKDLRQLDGTSPMDELATRVTRWIVSL
jgi:hypothetical protein